jgi:hypothetical protein
MIPQLIALAGSPWDVLPPGIHSATLGEVEMMFSYNSHRRALYAGLVDAAIHLAQAGCQTIILDGSYASGKPLPGDYDACWEPDGISASSTLCLVISQMDAPIKKRASVGSSSPQQ